jgi:hypothetical protein
MKKLFSLFTIAIAALSMSSCFEYKGVISVNKDGTATLEETSLVSAQTKAMLGSAGADGGGDPATATIKGMLADKAKAEARATTLGEGVTLKSHEEITMPDGRAGVKIVYAVPDITKLKYIPEGAQGKGEPMTFARSGNTLTIINPDKKKEKSQQPDVPKEAKKAQLAMIKPMMAGLHFAVEVKVPGGIASSEAAHTTGDTITMMEVDFDKVAKNDDNLVELLDSSNMTSAEAAAKFKGVDGIKVEAKENIKVEMK